MNISMILMCLFLFLFVCFIRLFIDLAFYETALLWQIFWRGGAILETAYLAFLSVKLDTVLVFPSRIVLFTLLNCVLKLTLGLNHMFLSLKSTVVASPGAPDLCTKSMYY